MNKVFRLSSLIMGILFFAIFMALACIAYYMTAGVFVDANLAVLYAVLGALGALAMMFRRYLFAVLFYVGCALGWVTGHYVSTLKGEFAPTAGVIATFFIIGAFSLVGLISEFGLFRRRRRKKAERQEAERLAEERRQQALLAEQKARAEQQAREDQARAKEAAARAEKSGEEPPQAESAEPAAEENAIKK